MKLLQPSVNSVVFKDTNLRISYILFKLNLESMTASITIIRRNDNCNLEITLFRDDTRSVSSKAILYRVNETSQCNWNEIHNAILHRKWNTFTIRNYVISVEESGVSIQFCSTDDRHTEKGIEKELDAYMSIELLPYDALTLTQLAMSITN